MVNNLMDDIRRLKKESKAAIFAHNYQIGEIQELADYVGDSFYLSKMAKEVENDFIVFCGVRFMAETAKILSPQKKVILPNADAGCPMADMVDPQDLREFKEKNPNFKVLAYVNTSAEVKALSDICVTSSVGEKIIKTVEENDILFLPDRNLGAYLHKSVSEKNMLMWNGFCPIHERVDLEDLENIKKLHPKAKILIHPECKKEVVEKADFIGSTAEIISFVKNSTEMEFIIGTEEGVIHKMKKDNPEKSFYPLVEDFVCKNMKKTTLEDLKRALEGRGGEIIELEEELRVSALRSLEEMMKRGE